MPLDGGVPITQTLTNSPYLTVDDASTYFSTRLRSDPWDDASPTDQGKALATATRAIDRLNYIGIKVDPAQENEFPRMAPNVGANYTGTTDVTIPVPQDILFACCEEALSLLDGMDPEFEMAQLHSNSSAYAGVRDTYDRSFANENVKAGIMSPIAWNFLRPWLDDSQSITLSRV